MKVYCKECKYILNATFTYKEISGFCCEYPENVNDWFGEEAKRDYLDEPKVLNVDNDCEWFEQKKDDK